MILLDVEKNKNLFFIYIYFDKIYTRNTTNIRIKSKYIHRKVCTNYDAKNKYLKSHFLNLKRSIIYGHIFQDFLWNDKFIRILFQ